MKKKLAVLLACHNRKKKTINCLNALFEAELPEKISLQVFLVDDGSSDGTSDSVKQLFPTVNIIRGDGTLFWNRGMHLAWEEASKKHDYDYYLWLNDDTIIKPKALIALLRSANSKSDRSIICGQCESEISGEITYGGLSLATRSRVKPKGSLQSCDYFNGNIVLIPRRVYQRNGNLDPIFIHRIGDFDYGLRAKKLGISSWVTPEAVAFCESNELPIWCNPGVSLSKRLTIFYKPLGATPFRYFVYANRHFGFFTAVKNLVSQHLRLFFPQKWV